MDIVFNDLERIRRAAEVGLKLNPIISEIICFSVSSSDRILKELAGDTLILPSTVCLLGSPLVIRNTVFHLLYNKMFLISNSWVTDFTIF